MRLPEDTALKQMDWKPFLPEASPAIQVPTPYHSFLLRETSASDIVNKLGNKIDSLSMLARCRT